MRVDQLLLTLHILAAATWIGAALALQVIAGHMRSSTPDAVTDRFAIDAETIGKTIFAPAAVVLLVTGVILVAHEHLGWTEAWLLIGIGAVVAAGRSAAPFSFPKGVGSPNWPAHPAMIPLRFATALDAGSLWRASTSSCSCSA
jgi:Predicted integral membrane protein (DUF2269)